MEPSPVFSRSSIIAKLPTYRAPSGAPMSEAEQVQYRRLAFAVVFEAWRKLKRPVDLNEIFWGVFEWKSGVKHREIVQGVQSRVQASICEGVWVFADFPRSKRTVDRRVNEAASPDYCENNVAKLVCVSPGIYQPNPVLLSEEAKA